MKQRREEKTSEDNRREEKRIEEEDKRGRILNFEGGGHSACLYDWSGAGADAAERRAVEEAPRKLGQLYAVARREEVAGR